MQWRALVGIDALVRVAIRAVELVKVYFLQVGFQQRPVRLFDVHVVLVRRIRTPVAAGCIDLDQDEPLHRRTRWQQVVYLPADVISTPDRNRHAFGLDQEGRVLPVAGRGGHGKFAVAFRRDLHPCLGWQVEDVARTLEHVGAAADVLPCAAI